MYFLIFQILRSSAKADNFFKLKYWFTINVRAQEVGHREQCVFYSAEKHYHTGHTHCTTIYILEVLYYWKWCYFSYPTLTPTLLSLSSALQISYVVLPKMKWLLPYHQERRESYSPALLSSTTPPLCATTLQILYGWKYCVGVRVFFLSLFMQVSCFGTLLFLQ